MSGTGTSLFANLGSSGNTGFNFSSTSTNKTGTSGSSSSSSTNSAFGKNTGFGFGSFGSFGSSTSQKPPEEVNFPPELKDKTVKDMLDQFEAQLNQQSNQFLTQAKQIARWDRSIFECLALMQHLEHQIKTIEGAQKELAQSTAALLQEQDAFIKTLQDKIKNKVESSTNPRQQLYRLAHELGEKYHHMENQLKEIVEQTDGQRQKEASSNIDKVTQIANCHLHSLQWISTQCQSIEETLDGIKRNLQNI